MLCPFFRDATLLYLNQNGKEPKAFSMSDDVKGAEGDWKKSKQWYASGRKTNFNPRLLS